MRSKVAAVVLPIVGLLVLGAIWTVVASRVQDLPSPLKTWQESKIYILQPLDKRRHFQDFQWNQRLRHRNQPRHRPLLPPHQLTSSHHQHLHRHIRRNKLQSELLGHCLFQRIHVWMLVIRFIPIEVDVVLIRQTSLIHHRDLETAFEKPAQSRQRLISAPEIPRLRTPGRSSLIRLQPPCVG